MTERPGHRDNPVDITYPGQLDRAVLRSWDPTIAQAEAGNYQKTHAIIGGLHVAIETPKNRIRSGVDPSGREWSVMMPAHYGYIKRTEGADGDSVDVYIGPEAHTATGLPVWIIDQADAETGAFDEHKCMLGFASKNQAHASYLAAFSDGKGQKRIGAVARTTFDGFRQWLAEGKTKNPVLMEKSASGCGCTVTHSVCGCQKAVPGDPMTKSIVTPTATVGLLSKGIASLFGRMNASERSDFLADAAVTGLTALGKAESDLLRGDEFGHIPFVEDQFDDGPTDAAKTVERSGPNSQVPGGEINTGPVQSASGEGGTHMERHYSRPERQYGRQRATEELGEKVAAHGRAMKSLIETIKSQQGQITLMLKAMESSVIDETAVSTMVSKAVTAALAKAMPTMIATVTKTVSKSAVRKAESDKDEDKDSESGEDDEEEDEDDDEEADQAESGGANEIEITNEIEEEDEDEDENDDEAKKATRKAAAAERIVAKSLLRLARQALSKADDDMKDERPHAGERGHKKARKRMEKARMHIGMAKAFSSGKIGPSMKSLERSLDATVKAAREMKSRNQDKWPCSTAGVSKAAPAAATTEAATASAGMTPETAKAIENMTAAIEKAVNGYAILQTDIQGFMKTLGGQSRHEAPPNPVTLVKSDAAGMSKEKRLAAVSDLFSARTINASDRDKAVDVIGMIEMGNLPQALIKANIDRLPVPVQQILQAAA